MKSLTKYRENKKYWQDLSFCENKSEKRGTYDLNEKLRYGILIEIQYDFQKSDEELIRFLFEQEIIAREKDSFQGIGNALWLGAYLLVQFENPDDIILFHRAKHANFDTGCGFDCEFMFLSLKDKTESFVFQKFPEIYNDINGYFSSMNLEKSLDKWWSNLSTRFPNSENDEPLYELYERNVYFENYTLAKEYLMKWKEETPDSPDKDMTLKYAYIELEEYLDAIELLKKELDTKVSNWDKTSCYRDLLKLYTKSKQTINGLITFVSIDNELQKFDEWKNVGLGRMTVHEAFEFSLITDNFEIGKKSFEIGYRWFKEMSNMALVGLEAGLNAAKKFSLISKVEEFEKLVLKEKERIKNM